MISCNRSTPSSLLKVRGGEERRKEQRRGGGEEEERRGEERLIQKSKRKAEDETGVAETKEGEDGEEVRRVGRDEVSSTGSHEK